MDDVVIPNCKRHPQYKGMKATVRDCDKCHIVYLSRRLAVVTHVLRRVDERTYYRYL